MAKLRVVRLAFTFMVVVSMACTPLRTAGPEDAGPTPQPPCLEAVPSVIDFGEVDAFGLGLVSVEFFNRSTVDREVQFRPSQPPFFLPVVPPSNSVWVPRLSRRVVEVEFRPLDGLLHLDQLEFTGGEGCNGTLVVSGLGGGMVRVEPRFLDFGFLLPGQEKTLEVQLINTRRTAVPILDSRLDSQTTAFSANWPPMVELPASSTTSFSITARPPGESEYSGSFTAVTPMGILGAGLIVVGGLPVAEVSPSNINVPIAGFNPAYAGQIFSSRPVRLRNLATSSGSSGAKLRLSGPTRVDALDGGLDEFFVQNPIELGNGLFGGEEAELTMVLAPLGVGPRAYRVTLTTNDPVHPEQVINFSANVERVEPCAIRVEPAVDLTLTAVGGVSEGTISFINEGNTRCVVDELKLRAPAGFSLMNAEEQFVVETGSTRVVTVRGPRSVISPDAAITWRVLTWQSLPQLINLHIPP